MQKDISESFFDYTGSPLLESKKAGILAAQRPWAGSACVAPLQLAGCAPWATFVLIRSEENPGFRDRQKGTNRSQRGRLYYWLVAAVSALLATARNLVSPRASALVD